MLHTPLKGVFAFEGNMGTTGNASAGTSVTTGGAAGTKGTAVELMSSLAGDCYWMRVIAHGYGAATTASQGCLDILTGAATESVLVANLLMGYCGSLGANPTGWKSWDFPIYIPAGTRIAAQAAGARTATAFRVGVIFFGADGMPPFRVGGSITTYGVSSVPNGTAITPGASGAEGSAAQIVASTTYDHFALVPSFQMTGDTTTNFRTLQVDIGIGAATEDFIQHTQWIFTTNDQEGMCGPVSGFPYMGPSIPSGTRLSMRASNSGTNDGGYDGAIHAVS